MAFQIMFYEVEIYCISDIGLIRSNNEDFWKVLADQQFFVLADGMGGHQAGEVASKQAVEKLCFLFERHFDAQEDCAYVQRLIKHAIKEVNSFVYRMGKEHGAWRGMGTTLCCALFHPEGLIYAHVGDSRIYRLRHGELEQLTQDHSLLCELIQLGQLSEQQAEEFLYKNIITKAIGTEPEVEPVVKHTTLEVGDLILMCTDGLSDLVGCHEIKKMMLQTPEEKIAETLVNKAKEKGGNDNITVIVVKVKEKYETDLP